MLTAKTTPERAPRTLGRLLSLVVAIALLAGPAVAQNYFPLEMDAEWDYVGVNDPANTLRWSVVDATDEYYDTFLDENEGAGWSSYFRFSQDSEGDTYFVAQKFGAGDWRLVEPPALYCDAPLYEGKTWSSVHTYNGTSELQIQHEVRSVAEMELLNGEIVMAYELWHQEVFDGVVSYEFTEWYAVDRGPVKVDWTLFTLSDVYVFLPPIVATEASSWSDVKSLFR